MITINTIQSSKKNCKGEKRIIWLTYKPGLALTGFRTIKPCFQQVKLTWARDPNKNQHLVSGKLQKHATLMSSKPEPAIWSRDTGQRISWYDSCQLHIILMSNINDIRCNPRLQDLVLAGWPPCCATSFVVVVVVVRRRWAHAPVIHAASHFDHKKRVSWVPISMHTCGSFFYNYGAPLGGPNRRSSTINRDLKHHDGSHDDGIPEAHFLFRSCAETE